MKAMALNIVLILMSSHYSMATSLWGSGVSQGSQMCPYPVAYGDGAVSVDDILVGYKKDLTQREKEIKRAEERLKKLTKTGGRIDARAQLLRKKLTSDSVADFIFEYIYDPNSSIFSSDCSQGSHQDNIVEGKRDFKQAERKAPAKGPGCDELPDDFCFECLGALGGEGRRDITKLCSRSQFAKDKKSCQQALEKYSEAVKKEKDLIDEIDALQEQKEEIATLIQEREWEIEDENDSAETEGVFCHTGNCDKKTFAKNVLVAGAAAALGIYGSKKIANINADLSFETPVNSGLLGAGLFAGTYGALASGVGRGSFGCSHTGPGFYQSPLSAYGSILTNAAFAGGSYYPANGQSGAFNYPQNYYQTPFGGNIFNQGMLPNGGLPGYNGNINGNFGIQAGVFGPFGSTNNGFGNNGFGQCTCIVAPCTCPQGSTGQFGQQQGPFGPIYNSGQQSNPFGFQQNGQLSPFGFQNGQQYPYTQQGFQQQQYYFQQQQLQAQIQLQYQQQWQQQQAARNAQLGELQEQLRIIYQQMAEIQSGSGLNYLGASNGTAGFNLNAGISAGASFSGSTTFGTSPLGVTPTNNTTTNPQVPISRGGN